MMNLTKMDVKRLINEPSAQVRSQLAGKIALDYTSGHFNSAEMAVAVDIFRILLKDIDKKIRKTLAEHLCASTDVPRDIILKLANDESDIAVPVLERSPILSEDDLIAIAESTAEVLKLCAISRRQTVSERLADSLFSTRIESVMKELFANSGAMLSERSLNAAWKNIAASDALLETLVHHGGLPLPIAEKLFYAVSEISKRILAKQYHINPALAAKAASDAREWEMLGILSEGTDYDPTDEMQVETLVGHLQANGRLTHSMIIRSLCIGNIAFFEAGMAALLHVPRVNARILLLDNGGLGFEAIYKAACMPEGFTEAVRMLLRISLEESEYGSGMVRPTELRKQVIERIYQAGYHHTVENMEYLLAIIGGKLNASSYVH